MAMQPVLKKQTILWLEPWLVCATISSPILLKEKKNPLLYKKSNQNRTNSVNLYLNKKKSHYENHKVISTNDFSKKITQKTFSALLTKKKSIQSFFSPLRSQNHMKKAQRHHDYLSSEWKKKSKYLNQRKKSPQVPKTISKFLTVRSCDKKVRKKLGQQKWKLKKKKHVKPKCDCKRKKGRKIKNLGIIELKIKKNTFFPIIKKIIIL